MTTLSLSKRVINVVVLFERTFEEEYRAKSTKYIYRDKTFNSTKKYKKDSSRKRSEVFYKQLLYKALRRCNCIIQLETAGDAGSKYLLSLVIQLQSKAYTLLANNYITQWWLTVLISLIGTGNEIFIQNTTVRLKTLCIRKRALRTNSGSKHEYNKLIIKIINPIIFVYIYIKQKHKY